MQRQYTWEMTGCRLLVTSGKLQSLSLITKSHPGPWQRERKGPTRSSSMYAYLVSQTLRDGNGCWLTSTLSAVAVSALLLCVWNMNTKEELIICKGYMAFHLELFRTSGQWGGHCPHAGQSSPLSVPLRKGPLRTWANRSFQQCTRCSHSGGSGRCHNLFHILWICRFGVWKANFHFNPVWAHLVNQPWPPFHTCLGTQRGTSYELLISY